MASEPQISSNQRSLHGDPLTSYLSPHGMGVLDSGEPLMSANPTDNIKTLVSTILIMEPEGGSETTISLIKEEPLEFASCQEEEQNLLKYDVLKDEPSDSSATEIEESCDSSATVKEERSDSSVTLKEEHCDPLAIVKEELCDLSTTQKEEHSDLSATVIEEPCDSLATVKEEHCDSLTTEIEEPCDSLATVKEEHCDPLATVKEEHCDPLATVKEKSYDSDSFLEETARTHWNLQRILTELNTDEQCIEFAIERGLLPAKKICHKHKTPMILQKRCRMGVFRCRKVGCRNSGGRKSRSSGTWFENLLIPLNKLFQIMYMFTHKNRHHNNILKQMTRDSGSTISSGSMSMWYANCREAIIVYHLKHRDPENKIGGPGKIVCIERSKMGERNFRIRKHNIVGQWVVGLIQMNGHNDIRLELCPDDQDSAEMVIPMIVRKHVKPGTKVHTDTFIANHCLSQGGFKLISSTVKTGEENKPLKPTDSDWKMIKAIFKKEQFQGNFTDWLVEYSWRRNIKATNKCAFEELLKAIQYSYNISV